MIIRNMQAARGVVSEAQAERLAPTIQVRTTDIDSFGSVATQRGYSSSTRRMPTSITLVLDNSAGLTDKVYILGDPDDMIVGKTGATYAQPDAAQGTSVAAFRNSLRSAGLLISGVNYNTTDGIKQFSKNFSFAQADYDNLTIQDIFSNEAERNTAQNPNLLTIRFKEAYELDWNAAFIITVAAGEQVNLTLFIGAASGR